MNNPNPISPLTPLAQGGRGNRNVRIAVISIAALHGVFFAGLLFQGCDRRPEQTARKDADSSFLSATNTTYGSATALTNSPYADITNWPSYATQYSGAASNALAAGAGAATPQLGAGAGATGAAGTGAGLAGSGGGLGTGGGFGAGATGGGITGIETVTDLADPGAVALATYKIKKGDTLAKIASANGITMKALTDANPGLDPKKLQIDKELKLPAAKKTMAAAAGTATSGGAVSEGTSYTVVKGDTLTGIARKFGVTVPEIRKANGLKTDSIAAGKKLKIPASAKPATTTTAPVGTATPGIAGTTTTVPQ